MLILNDKQFKDLVKKKRSKAIYFFEGHGQLDPANKYERPIERMICDSNEALLKELAEWSDTYPGKFTCYIHTTENAIRTHGNVMRVDLSIKERKESNPETATAVVLNRAEIEQEIRAKLKLETETAIVKKQLELAEMKLKEQEKIAGKLALVGYKFVEQLQANSVAASMQGLQPGGGPESETQTESNIDDSIEFLREKLGDKTLIILASKINKNPDLAGTIKNMIL